VTAQFLDLIATLATSTPGAILAQVTLALAAGLIATACVRRARASVRHAMLTATLAVALVLPVGVLLLPAVAIEIPMVDVAPQPAPIRIPQLAFPAAQSPLPLLLAGQGRS